MYDSQWLMITGLSCQISVLFASVIVLNSTKNLNFRKCKNPYLNICMRTLAREDGTKKRCFYFLLLNVEQLCLQ